MLVSGLQRVVKIPVHFPLAVRVLVVVLIGVPAQLQHVIADFADHVEAAHEGLLVIARLCGGIEFIRFGRQQGSAKRIQPQCRF